MDQGGFHIRGCRWPHHEAPVCCFVESHPSVSLVHIQYDLFRIQQNNEMLGQHSQGIHDKIFLR